MSKRFRTMVLALISLMCCIAVIAVGTYALFTDEVTVENHLKAGELKVTLKRTELVWNKLDSQGYLASNASNPDRTIIDYTDTNTNDENIFGLDNGEVVVPQSSYKAKMEVTNGGDVAFGCWFQTKIMEGSNTELAQQLVMKITTIENGQSVVRTATVKDGFTVGSKTDAVKVPANTNSTMTFWVEIYFADSDNATDIEDIEDLTNGAEFDNNDAMNDTIKFDLIVSAVQLTSRQVKGQD